MRQSLHIRTYSFYRLSLARQHKETIQYLISTVQDFMLLKQPHIGPQSIIFEVISVIPVISVNHQTGTLLRFSHWPCSQDSLSIQTCHYIARYYWQPEHSKTYKLTCTDWSDFTNMQTDLSLLWGITYSHYVKTDLRQWNCLCNIDQKSMTISGCFYRFYVKWICPGSPEFLKRQIFLIPWYFCKCLLKFALKQFRFCHRLGFYDVKHQNLWLIFTAAQKIGFATMVTLQSDDRLTKYMPRKLMTLYLHTASSSSTFSELRSILSAIAKLLSSTVPAHWR